MAGWLRWGWPSALVIALMAACGGEGTGTPPVGEEDSGQTVDASVGPDVSSDGGASNDATLVPDAPRDSTLNDDSLGPPIDASLDIAFPDVFTQPDATIGSDAGTDASFSDACAPGVTCNGNTAVTCSNGNVSTQNCGAQVCAPGFGCRACIPGTGSCNGDTASLCRSDGSGYDTSTCDPLQGLACNAGTCTGACANVGQSYIGCEYYAVTMANRLLAQATFFFSISISNTGTSAASVNISRGAAFNQTVTVNAGAIAEVQLPWVSNISMAQNTLVEANGAYRIRSTQPITVYQFNPRDYQIGNTRSYTNDASLLIPVNALTGNYRVVGYPSFWGSPGLMAVVATQDATSVTVAPSVAITAGGGLAANGGTITMNRGDVLQITNPAPANQSYGGDMSGSLITANRPVEVFGGHNCVYVDFSQGYCDHLEEIIFPIETLRSDYLVTLPHNANGTPQQFIKIVGTQNGTTLTFDPAVTGNQTINAGQVVTFETTQNFRVTSSAPIIVGQYMEGCDNFTRSDTCGDPAMTTAVATAQFRKSYQFVSPANYGQNWVNVIAPTGSTVLIDGQNTVTNWVAIGSSGYSVGRASLCANNAAGCTGVHVATSSAAFGIQVYGYGTDTSYSYPGGLDLRRQ